MTMGSRVLGSARVKLPGQGGNLDLTCSRNRGQRGFYVEMKGVVSGQQIDTAMGIHKTRFKNLADLLARIEGPGQGAGIQSRLAVDVRGGGSFSHQIGSTLSALDVEAGTAVLSLDDGGSIAISTGSGGESEGTREEEGDGGGDPGSDGGDGGDGGDGDGGDGDGTDGEDGKDGDDGKDGEDGGGGGSFWDIFGILAGAALVAVGVLASMGLVALVGAGMISAIVLDNALADDEEGPISDKGGCTRPPAPEF